jgi:hypothetical protein
MEKKLLEKQRLFLSLVETMSLYKDSENKKDKVFYKIFADIVKIMYFYKSLDYLIIDASN